jgi:hypothetical protein
MEIEKIKKSASNAYNLCCVLKNYSNAHQKIEEISHIYTLVEHIHDNIDIINNYFINDVN